jgi:hypothetical protein
VSICIGAIEAIDYATAGVIDQPESVEKDSDLCGSGAIPIGDHRYVARLPERKCSIALARWHAGEMPAQIEYESALPEQSQRNVAGAEPIAYNGYVSRLPKRQDGFVPRVNNAVAIDIEDPSPIAEDADSFLAGSIPISHYRQVGSVTEHGRLGRISDMPEIGSNNLFALKSIGSPSSPKSHRIIALTNI